MSKKQKKTSKKHSNPYDDFDKLLKKLKKAESLSKQEINDIRKLLNDQNVSRMDGNLLDRGLNSILDLLKPLLGTVEKALGPEISQILGTITSLIGI